ncbi:SDR family oxidoreductase [bacterium]|nr:SDR family oxidoreductase [bacterium]
MRGKRALVAGGAGFIGCVLTEKLVEQGYSVVVVDNLSTGCKEKISHLVDGKRCVFFQHDIVNPIDFQVDLIVNLACPASPPAYQKDPIQTLKTSVIGSLNLLELARKHRAKIVQASTSEVYGSPLKHPQSENYWGNVNPIGIRSCYDEGKRAAETLFFDYHRQYGIDIKIMRIFNTYGPQMDIDDGRAVSNFVKQAVLNEPITIYGDGKQTRSFCYVDDLVYGIMKLINVSADFTGPVNIGNSEEITLRTLAEEIKMLANSSSPIIFKALPSDDPQNRKPDLTLAHEVLGWEPKISREYGLLKTIEFFRQTLSNKKNHKHQEVSL